ncbi:MAG: hypothetical protein ACLP9C_03710 [Acidimicrobiales bacterium]
MPPRPRRSRRAGLAVTSVLASLLVPLAAAAVLNVAAATPAAAANPAWANTPVWEHVLNDGGDPVAESSPNVAILDSDGPSVVVGDRDGFVYGFHIVDGSPVAGWPVATGAPVDSTPSVADIGGGADSVFVGSGNAADPTQGGYQAFGPSGNLLWFTGVTDPGTDTMPAQGVQASLSVGPLEPGATDVVAGSLDQEEYALDAGSGVPLTGWPFFTSDSVFSTAALGDLYGTNQTEIVEGSDQSDGFGVGQNYTAGGHLRILNSRGGLICHYDTNQTVDSSPAIGGFLAGGATGAVFGTGGFFPGASDTNTVRAVDSDCNLQWSTTLDGDTTSSPALADLSGDGTLDVVEGTNINDTSAPSTGSVWALNGTNGQVLWSTSAIGAVIGSVTTADLFGQGEDVLVPTLAGVEILNGTNGAVLAELNASSGVVNGILGFQNSPLVTTDPNGTVGITIAGYNGFLEGVIEHFEIPGSNGPGAIGPGSWPMFHHDPQLTGNAGGTPAPGTVPPCQIPSAAFAGYDLVASDGGIFSFGGSPFCGSTGGTALNAPIVGMAQAPNTGGYWLVASDGGVFAYGGAQFYGSMGGQPLNKPIVGIAANPDGKGYWLVASDGGIFAFGDAQFWGSTGSMALTKPIVGIVASPDGLGYRLAAADGGIFAFGDAQYFGSMGGKPLVQPIVGIADDINSAGYWLVAADGGIFAFGGAAFAGSEGGKFIAAPIVGIAPTNNGSGYRFVASDGGIFSYGSAAFFGSMGGQPLNAPIVGMSGF